MVNEQLGRRHGRRDVAQMIQRVGQLVMSIEYSTAMGTGPPSVRLLDGAEEPGHPPSIYDPWRPIPVTNVPDPRVLLPLRIVQGPVGTMPTTPGSQ